MAIALLYKNLTVVFEESKKKGNPNPTAIKGQTDIALLFSNHTTKSEEHEAILKQNPTKPTVTKQHRRFKSNMKAFNTQTQILP